MARWSARVRCYLRNSSIGSSYEMSISSIIADSEYEARKIILSKAASMKLNYENFEIIEIHQMGQQLFWWEKIVEICNSISAIF